LKSIFKLNLENDYVIRLVAITSVFCLTIFLSERYGQSTSLLIANTLSLVATPIIWKHDGILKIDIKWKYVGYYLTLLIAALVLSPKDSSTIINILYRQGFREEVLYRLFMVGIFLKYGYSEDKKEQQYFLFAVFYSNFLFMLGHPYGFIGLLYIFVTGIVFSYIYLFGGLPSSILAHTIHNLYRMKEQTILILLLFVPLVVNISIFIKIKNRVLQRDTSNESA
jgi:hypothetical protein